jgi:hypothetical protein
MRRFSEYVKEHNLGNLFNVNFVMKDDGSVYLTYIERKTDFFANVVMDSICKLADDCSVDITLDVVPKDLSNKTLTLPQFRKNQNTAKIKLENYFSKYGFVILRKEVRDLFIEIEMIRKYELH